MHLTVNGIKPRAGDDPDYADFWLELVHMDSGISWEVPLSKDELRRIHGYLPKWVRAQVKTNDKAGV